ncbi:AT hook motif-containing protein, partial [Trifolium medium]|nr:AT hook motif-containing protein [Trifolium medium]
MDQQNQNNTPDGSGDVPMKRKRGRPRKYPRPDSEESSYMLLNQSRKQTPVRVEQAPIPSGFQAVNGNQHLQSSQESESNSNNAMVGQVVTGVIEAVFDAGFLLSVRVGNSDTILKGLVFKSGHFVPVCPENDVAPGVPMIQRNEVPFPSRPTQFQTPLPKEKNGQPASVSRVETLPMNGSQSAPQVPRGAVSSSNLAVTSRNVPMVTSQTTDQLARGNAMPVLFQPNFSNGMPVSTPPSQLTPVSLVSGVNIVGKEIPVGGN